jgi:3-deoxy-D-manno-octulosonate 8-phosphate phosphatase KdsC-like HAD superfamily phosphatase
VKVAAHWIAGQAGGRGAVRAFAEFILRAKGVDFAGMTHG